MPYLRPILKSLKSLLLYASIAALMLVSLLPIVLMLITSLKEKVQIFDADIGFFFVPTLSNYRAIFADKPFMSTLGNSLLVGSMATIITLIVGTMCAYALVRFRFMGRATVNLSNLLLRVIPPAVLAVPVFGIWTFDYHLSNQLTGLLLVYTAMNLPFVIWVLQSFIRQIPVELEEAAYMDGASPWQVFYCVVLPLLRPGLAAAGIFTFRIAWNEFILALVLTNRATRTAPVYVSLFMTEYNVDWGKIMVIGTLIAIPPLIFVFIAAKQMIQGLSAGAVKG